MQDQRVARPEQVEELLATNAALRSELSRLKDYQDKLEDDTDWLLNAIKAHEDTIRQLTAENRTLKDRLCAAEALIKRVERSVGYRVFRPLRKVKAMMGSLGIMGRPRTD